MSDTKKIVDTETIASEVSSEETQPVRELSTDIYRPTPTPFPEPTTYEAK